MFQSLALFPHLTAQRNVEYGIDRARPRAERYQRAREMLERMRVGHLADRKPATFSGGEAQRVALARAFARSPRLVLLDEPFSAMDRDLRLQLATDVRGYVDEAKLPLIHVTHHRNEARAIADRVVLLEPGGSRRWARSKSCCRRRWTSSTILCASTPESNFFPLACVLLHLSGAR